MSLMSKTTNGSEVLNELPAATAADVEAYVFPLSFAQQRLWFLHQLAPHSHQYNLTGALLLSGALKVEALADSFNEIVRRHETLRTAFALVDGEPMQVIAPHAAVELEVVRPEGACGVDDAAVGRWIAEASRRPFVLSRAPLLRVALLRLDADEHLLLVTMHHLISDAWSIAVLVRELTALYAAFSSSEPSPLPELPIQYADFTLWQKEWVEGGAPAESLVYWRRQLSGSLPTLSLHADRPRPPVQTFEGARLNFELTKDFVTELGELGRREGATLSMTFLTTFLVLLHRYTGEEDLLVGLPVANRQRTDIENLIGFFVNLLPLRANLSGDPSFAELLRRVKQLSLEAYEHQSLPVEKLIEDLPAGRSPGRTQLFQVVFDLHEALTEELRLPGIVVRQLEIDNGTAKFDLALSLERRAEGVGGYFEYSTDVFEREGVERMHAHWRTLLASVLRDPALPVSRLPMLSDAERRQLLVEWNQTARPVPAGTLVPQLFEETARRHPDRPALVWGAQTVSYGQLREMATQVERRLRRCGVGAEALVGVMLGRGPGLVAALLGVLKAGAAYLPLDEQYPAERIEYMLRDGGVRVLICDEEAAERWRGKVGEVLTPAEAFEEVAGEAERQGMEGEVEKIEGGRLAYVIYTSGSTGRPKGVAVQHASLANLVRWHQQTYEVGPTDRATLLAGLSFDAAVWELWPYLTAGASLYIPADEETRISPAHLKRWLVENEINVSFVTTPLAEQLIAGEWPAAGNSLRALLTGGDRLTRHPSRGFSVPLINHYGPTESTVVATAGPVPLAGAEEGLPSIGRPIANTRIYVLDRKMNPTPVGVTGELYVGGAGLARGYWKRPGLTAASFVPDPFSGEPGARMYRTGDLARYRRGGELEYAGRADRQVKVRGHRIELAEVERVLEERGGVAAVAVVLRREESGDARLVAFVVRGAGAGDGAGDGSWDEYVRARLPEAMRPWVVRELEGLPLTANGKVDREELERLALAERHDETEAGATRARTTLEELLVGIWEEVLGVTGVGVHDDFFALGGHSLLATQAVSRVSKALQAELPLRALFEAPTVAALAERINLARAGARPVTKPIAAADRSRSLPVSFAQHRLWFLELFQPGSSLFHMPAALRLEGRLDVEALRESLNLALRRHEILSAKFAVEDGQPVMLLPPAPLELSLPIVELESLPPAEQDAEVRRLAAEEAHTGFDLVQGPLIRARLLRLREESHVLLITIHHIVTDGWSMNVLTEEVGAGYAALAAGRQPSPPPLPIQYVDYAAWQREVMRGEFLEHLLGYWRGRLAGELPVLDLPLDFTRPVVQTFNGARAPLTISADFTREMRGFARREGATLYMILLGAWQTLLHRYTGQADVLTGTLIANRHRLETESIIGCLINALPIRTDLSADPSFEQLLEQVRRVSLEAYEHQDLPFEMLVEDLQLERNLSRPPLIQVMFGFENIGLEELQLSGVQLTPVPVETDAVAYDLTLTLAEKGGRLVGALEYNTDLFTRATAERMVGHFLTLLEAAVRDPSQRVSRLPLLTGAEQLQLLNEWNRTARDYPLESGFHQLFERQAAATPDAVAVRTDETRLSYAELNAAADRAAGALRAQGVGADEVVVLLAERGAEFLIAMLALFKAGGAYLPLDPRYPAQRLAQIIGRSGSRLAVAAGNLTPRLDEALRAVPERARPRTLLIEDLLGAPTENAPAGNPQPRGGPRNLAYVLFTSGSTGVPKGAMIEQRGMVNHLLAKVSDLGLRPDDIVVQNASQCFDISVWQFLSALLVGGSVRIVNDEVRHDPLGLLALCEREGVSVLEVVPSLLQAMLEEVSSSGQTPPRLASLRWMVVTGEALPPPLARRWHALYPDIPLLNAYGPTECSDDVTHHVLTAPPEEHVLEMPIGRPIANTRLYVLDKHLRPVPVGVPGELYVGGAGVGRGYLGSPGRTAEVFIPDPLGDEPGAVLYKTGDLVSYLPGGELRFLGRVDHQVKIRGFRIELGEIETVLRRHPLIADAAVLDHANGEGEKVLTAYVTTQQQPARDAQEEEVSGERVQQWQDVFDGVYAQTEELADGTLNLSGWIDSYTGEPIPEEEMRSWVEATVENILALRPRRVLELGCGAGLLLLRLAPHCQRYWGTDFAPQSLRYLSAQPAFKELRGTDVNLLQRPADDFSGLAPDSFDAVVLNSVAQYFPGVDYLLQVLKGAVEVVAPGGFIYVGDIRNRRLLEAFHLSVQAHKVEPGMSREDFAAHVRHLMSQEDELLLDPEFFFALKDSLPKIGHVEIRPKRGRHHNELTRFRYDVVLRLGEVEKPPAEVKRLDWWEARLTLPELERMLDAERPEAVLLTNLPDARIAAEAHGLRWLGDEGAGEQPRSVGEWLRAAAGEREAGADPEDLLDLALRTPYEVALSCARTGPEGSFEAALARRDAAREGAAAAPSTDARAALLFGEPARRPSASWGRYANNPLQGAVASTLLPQLRAFLAERLPEYMVPAVFVALESLPLTANGKLDRRALLKPHASQLTPASQHVAARTPAEETVARIWQQVLGLPRVGVHDKFFDIGGDSLKIVRVFRLLNEVYPNVLTVVDLFKHSTVEEIAAELDGASQQAAGAPELQGFEL